MPIAQWSQPHHDGSPTYVPEPTPTLGGTVPVLLRVPRSSDVTSAWVRVIEDGEPELVRARVDREDLSLVRSRGPGGLRGVDLG